MPFATDIQKLRSRARKNIEDGAVTASYELDRDAAVEALNGALATELVCVLRYRRHHFMASGIHSESVKAEFLVHAQEEQAHADLLAERIVQLGGEPNFNPEGLSARSHAEYVEGNTLAEMIREDLIAERIAIDSYREMIAFFGAKDSTTRTILEKILSDEEEHAEEMSSLLDNVGPAPSEPTANGTPSRKATSPREG